MAFRKETFGTLENGAVITKYILTNEHGLKAALRILEASGWKCGFRTNTAL